MKRALLALALAAVACGGHNGGEPLGANSPGIVVKPLDTPGSGLPGGPKPAVVAKSHLCGEIERKAIGPFTARYADGGLVAWIETAKLGGGQELRVVPTGVDGAPLAEPRVVTKVPQEATQLFVRPAGGTRGGWLVAWSALLDRGESLSIVGLAPDGTDRIKATDVQRTSDHVKWADMVPGPKGSVMLWAEETPSGSANVLAVGVDADGKPRGLPTRVARGVVGWATARTDDGVGLALVSASAGDRSGPGSLSWVRLDAEGHPVTAPVPIGTQPTVSSDVDAVAVPGGWLLAWTDRTREDAQVMLATVDAAGHVKGPRRAMDAVGGTTLAALATGPAGTALLWQEPRGRAREVRTLHVATVTTSGEPAAQPMTAFAVASKSIPELAATEHGFALLAVARSCGAGEHVGACDGPEMPLVVRLDARLSPVQTEPLYVGLPRQESSLGWGLRCAGDRCVALAATGESPTPVYTVELAPRESPFAPPSVPPPPVDAPRATGLVTVASGQPFTQVDATTLGRTTLLATLTTAVDTIPKGQERRGPSRGPRRRAAVRHGRAAARRGDAADLARAPGGRRVDRAGRQAGGRGRRRVGGARRRRSAGPPLPRGRRREEARRGPAHGGEGRRERRGRRVGGGRVDRRVGGRSRRQRGGLRGEGRPQPREDGPRGARDEGPGRRGGRRDRGEGRDGVAGVERSEGEPPRGHRGRLRDLR